MSQLLNSTPKADGFWMPGEFEPHDGCWMLFPERPDVWRENAKPAQAIFAAVATAIAQFEPVTIGASAAQLDTARSLVGDTVRVVEISADDAWLRDCGPSFVINTEGDLRGVDWEFNAWGGLYADWARDNRVAQKVIELAGADRYKTDVVVEGGAIHVDGQGTLITTRSCLLNDNRNPGRSEAEITQRLMDYTGAEKVIWLDAEAHPDEETDGHVDGICAFVEPGVLVLDWYDDPAHAYEYETCRQHYEQLSATRDAKGRPFTIHKLPGAILPPTTAEEAAGVVRVEGTLPRLEGDILGGCYTNFYIANGGIVMPTYDHPNDEIAKKVLADLFKDRKVVGVPSRELTLAGGMIHCITQQQPSVHNLP